MVSLNYLFTAVRILQLFAVMGVCFNHWSITLLKGSSPIFSDAAYREAALFGLVFLFFSSGFMSQLTFSESTPFEDKRNVRLDFVIGRYLRLLLPVIAAVTFDYWLQGYADHSQTRDLPRAMPFLMTLTQTWHYSILGATSLAEPGGGSNMAWLGANLFFLAIFFGFTSRIWNRIQSGLLICSLLGAFAVVLAFYLNAVYYFSPQINAWAAERYGADLNMAYGLGAWLVEYCPYVNLLPFMAGILVGRLVQIEKPGLMGAVLVAAVLFGILVPGDAAYLGWSIALLVFVARWIEVFLVSDSHCGRLLDPTGLLARLGASAYEVYVLHLVIYLAFTLAVTPILSAYGVILLTGRVVVVNCLMLLLCLGFSELYFARWQVRAASVFGFKYSGDLRYV